MIRYALKCADDHAFESWFQSAAAFDALQAQGHVTCPLCGSARVEKALMAPAVRPAPADAPAKAPAPAQGGRPNLTAPATAVEEALAALRRQVEENSEYVGMNFAAEARRIHDGDAPERSIYGEARPDEARKLIEDGVPVTPLPFLPPRKAN
ncbi:MAG: hypothetical protein RIR62_2992 [Pseudomonadota bacterium]